MEFLEAALSDFYQARQPSSTSSSLASSLPDSSSSASSRGGLYIAGFPGTGKEWREGGREGGRELKWR